MQAAIINEASHNATGERLQDMKRIIEKYGSVSTAILQSTMLDQSAIRKFLCDIHETQSHVMKDQTTQMNGIYEIKEALSEQWFQERAKINQISIDNIQQHVSIRKDSGKPDGITEQVQRGEASPIVQLGTTSMLSQIDQATALQWLVLLYIQLFEADSPSIHRLLAIFKQCITQLV